MSSIKHWIRKASTPRPRLDGFMTMNDRTLADIGVRRIDVQAAMSGVVPARRIWAPTTAEVHTLRPEPCRQPTPPVATGDLSEAA